MRKALLALVVVAAFGGIAWLAGSDGSSRETSTEAPSVASASREEPRASTLERPRALAEDERPDPRDAVEPAARAPVEATVPAAASAFEPWPAEEVGLEVLVVRSVDDEPVPRAEVLWLSNESIPEEAQAEAMANGFDITGMFERYGRRFRADEAGRLRVPRPVRSVNLLGRAPELLAIESLEAPKEPYRLALHPDPTLRVRVVDEAGAPVPDVPVAMRLGFEDGGIDLTKTRTDAEGRARIEHIEPMRGLVGDEGTFYAAISAPLTEAVEVPIETYEEEITLVLPPCGALEVRLVDAGGRPVTTEALLESAWYAEGEVPPTNWRRGSDRNDGAAFFEEGVARLFPVALDLRFDLRISGRQGIELGQSRGVFGPERAGEVVTEVLPVQLGARVRMRVVDEEGAPLAGEVLTVFTNERDADDWHRERSRVETDAEGRFTFALGAASSERERWLEVARLGIDAAIVDVARVSLASQYPGGTTDLGDVVLSAAERLVSGRVVDEAGRPIGGASVRVSAVRLSSGVQHVTELRALATRSDAEGRFEVRGTVAADELQLRTSRQNYFTAEAQVTVGTRDLRLEMGRAASLSLALTLDEGLPAARLQAIVTAPGAGPFRRRLEPDGTANFPSLPATLVDVSVLGGGVEEPLWTERAELVAGETTELEVDLRGRLTLFQVRVLGDLGVGIPARIQLRSAGQDTYTQEFGADANGEVLMLAPSGPIDLRVSAADHRAQELLGVDPVDVVVRLERGPEVVVRHDLGVLRERERLYLGLGRGNDKTWVPLEGSETRLYTNAVGVHQVSLFLQVLDADGQPLPGEAFPSPVPEVEVTERGARFELVLDEAALEAARP